MEVRAEIVRLQLAETFVISREAPDWADVVHVTLGHDGVDGRGEAAPIERYGETAESALAFVERARPPRRRRSVRARGDRRAARGRSRASRRRRRRSTRRSTTCRGSCSACPSTACSGSRGAGPPTSWTVWLGDPDDMARRAAEAAPRFRRLKLKLGRRRRPRRRARARRARGHGPARSRSTSTSGGRSTRRSTRCGELAALGVEYVEQPLPRGRRGRRRAPAPLAGPDLRRRGLPHARRRRRLPRDRARRQHQAREVGRHPRGDPDGARRAGARARRDARLHGRVGARDRRGLLRRSALRPRRPRRQPAARATTRARARARRTASRSRPTRRAWALGCGVSATPSSSPRGSRTTPHYGKTMRGVLRYRREDVVAILDSARAGETHDGVPIVGTRRGRARASSRRSRSSASRRRAGGSRRRGASSCRAASRAGLDVENGLHEMLADDPELVRSPAARRRAARPAPAAGRPRLPDRARTSRSTRRSSSPSAPTARSGR